MRRIIASMAILAAAAMPALADENAVVKTVNLQQLQTILTEEGYTINSSGDDGAVSVRATDTNGTGLIFNVFGAACDLEGYDTGCLGINMQVRYDADGQETLELINEANLMWAATSAWYSAGGTDGISPTVGIARYVILDGGMTIRNIKDNLLNLLAIAPQAADYIWQVGEYGPGGADDAAYDDDEW
ncbi:MAG: YbjN domain-containing protein [Hyphomonas sp.]|uniref:YbjN domain-containing protein n=1 Tax=Hyphomonas sp. TaxID=87 RepID=UPI0034A0AA61